MRDHPAIAARFEAEYLRELDGDVRGGKRIGRRADWHFGGGAGYCGHCAELGEPCAEGRPGRDGKLCPYQEHAPQTLDGEIAWGLLASGQWQRGGMDGRLAGLDIAACLARPAARGADPDVLEYLLAVGEAAAVNAANRKEDG